MVSTLHTHRVARWCSESRCWTWDSQPQIACLVRHCCRATLGLSYSQLCVNMLHIGHMWALWEIVHNKVLFKFTLFTLLPVAAPQHGTGCRRSWNCCNRRTHFVVIWKHFCFILLPGTRIRIDSVMRPWSSSRGRNTSASVTVTDFYLCASVTKQYNLALAKWQWRTAARRMTADQAESTDNRCQVNNQHHQVLPRDVDLLRPVRPH